MTMRCPGLALPLVALTIVAGCNADDDPAADGSGTSLDGTSETGEGATTQGDDDSTGDTNGAPNDATLIDRLGGLWVAPVTSWTSAGSFPTMNMDMRPADDRVLFSRVDLDADNALRFAFSRETHEGESVLVFRNGGLFQGLERDTRTRLVEHDPATDSWRFCAITGGCMYVEAVFDFDGDDAFTMEVSVLGMNHVRWSPTRREERELSSLADAPEPNASDAPFPAMPSARIALSWSEPLAEDTEAWVILSTTNCSFNPGSCTPSRFMRATAPAGATQTELVLHQLHAGAYKVNAVLDRNGNLHTTLFPDGGDSVSLPNQSLDVAPSGETAANFTISIDL
jgi:hypothetical protein